MTKAAICLILLAILGGASYEAYHRLESMNTRVDELTRRVDRALDIAEQAAGGASVADI